MSACELLAVGTRSFESLSSLEELFIIDMVTLEHIEDNAFDGLRQLTSLVIRGNKNLKAFPCTTLPTDELQTLEEIFLNNNGIQKFPEALISTFGLLPDLEMVSITDNPVHCDCSAKYLRDFILTSDAIWARSWKTDGIRCSTPVNLKAVPLVDIRRRDLTCDSPTVSVVWFKHFIGI